MKYRRLGRTGLNVSLIGFGTGGPSSFGQTRGASFEEQYALVHGALDLGINFFDTAAGYRASEEILGRTLAGVRRDTYYIASKCSLTERFGGAELVEAENIITQCERSLERLGTDVIDVYQLHGVRPERFDEVVERFYPALDKLRQQGKIRFTGLTELFSIDPRHEMLKCAVLSGQWDTIMVKYGILNQTADHELLPLCLEQDVGVLNMAAVRVALASPEALAKLMAEWVEKGVLARDALPSEDPLGWLIDGETESIISASYKFGASHPAISTLLTGTSSLEHLCENVESVLGPPLPAAKMDRVRSAFGDVAAGGDV